MIELVRRYSNMVNDGRSLKDIYNHAKGEMEELDQELLGNDGIDGIFGESIDVIACMFDLIIKHKPAITQEEIDVYLEKKLQKWVQKSQISSDPE